MSKREMEPENSVGEEDDEPQRLYVPLKVRKRQLIEKHLKTLPKSETGVGGILNEDTNSQDSIASAGHNSNHSGSGASETLLGPKYQHLSLLEQHTELKKKASQQMESEREKQLKEEEKILATVAETKALLSFSELAKGIQYFEPIKTNWTVPRCILNLTQARHDEVREKTGIQCEGENVPPPICSFKDMKLPKFVVHHLKDKGILKPTPIQMQGLPAL
jgi:ATP-dependent RNA helicase DDX41